MKTADLNKGDYFKTNNDPETVYAIVEQLNNDLCKVININTDMYVHLFLNVEVSAVLTEEEKEAVNDFYGI